MNVIIPGADINLVAMVHQPPTVRAKANKILAIVAGHWDVSADDIKGPRRFHDLVRARDAVAWLLHTKLNRSSTWIGRYLNRDHTTILQALDRARKVAVYGDVEAREFEYLAQIYDHAINTF